jgi:hypothetical protein
VKWFNLNEIRVTDIEPEHHPLAEMLMKYFRKETPYATATKS